MTIETDFDNLVNDIKYSGFVNSQEATGFFSLHCPICGENKKKTGGFKFESDKIVYNCFRGSCDANTVYERGNGIPKKFKALMGAINVTIPPTLRVRQFQQKLVTQEEWDERLLKPHTFKPISLPNETLQPLIGANPGDPLTKRWIDYFTSRKVSYRDVILIHSGDYKGNCIIPFYYNGILIGMQIITKSGYVAANQGNSHVIYAPDGHLDGDLVIVVEGTIDAKSLPFCVATLNNRIKPEQAWFLKSKKNVIMLPDRTGGNEFVKQFHQYDGWGLCVPPWGEKDLNAAVCKYGVFTVSKMIRDYTYYQKTKAESAFRMWSK